METIDVRFSDLLRDPKRVTAKLDSVPALHVHRRDAEDLVITTATRDERRQEGASAVAQLFNELMRQNTGAQAVLASLPAVYPWMRFLPADDTHQFSVELVRTLRACAEIDAYDALHELVMVWRKTAAIWADPDLAQQLQEPLPGEDFGEVDAP